MEITQFVIRGLPVAAVVLAASTQSAFLAGITHTQRMLCELAVSGSILLGLLVWLVAVAHRRVPGSLSARILGQHDEHATTLRKIRLNTAALDGLRAVATLHVCAYHYVRYYGAYVRNFDLLGECVMNVFYLLSGFVLTLNYGARDKPVNTRKFLVRRLARLAPLFYLSNVLMLPALLCDYHVKAYYVRMGGYMGLCAQSGT